MNPLQYSNISPEQMNSMLRTLAQTPGITILTRAPNAWNISYGVMGAEALYDPNAQILHLSGVPVIARGMVDHQVKKALGRS